jgi:hypothetical protein
MRTGGNHGKLYSTYIYNTEIPCKLFPGKAVCPSCWVPLVVIIARPVATVCAASCLWSTYAPLSDPCPRYDLPGAPIVVLGIRNSLWDKCLAGAGPSARGSGSRPLCSIVESILEVRLCVILGLLNNFLLSSRHVRNLQDQFPNVSASPFRLVLPYVIIRLIRLID